jgi:hypothetical protein
VLKVILQYRSVEILPLTPYKEVKQEKMLIDLSQAFFKIKSVQ